MEAAEEIASILNSLLPSEEKSMLLAAYWPGDILPAHEINKSGNSSGVHLQDKIQHKEANTKEDDDVISERKDESPSLSSSQQSKAKGALDPFIIDEVSSIFKSDLTLEDKSSVLGAILIDEDTPPSKVNTATTSQEVELQHPSLNSGDAIYVINYLDHVGKNQDSEEKAKGGHDNLLNDGMMEKIDKPLSPQQEPKANIDTELKLNLEKESAHSGAEKDIPPSEDDTSSTSSKVELEEIDQVRETKASRQVGPVESCRILLDSITSLQEHEFLTVTAVGSSSISDGKEDELSIHKQEAACKYCHILMFQESCVLKAKCGCTLSLIHEECANAWSREKGNKCSYCEQEIKNIQVTLSAPLQTIGEKPDQKLSFEFKRSWCCFG